jgi:hypothetical protein
MEKQSSLESYQLILSSTLASSGQKSVPFCLKKTFFFFKKGEDTEGTSFPYQLQS